MKLITADFETHYSQTFSLTKLTTEAYIRSPEFEVIGVAIKEDDGPTRWYPQPQVQGALAAIDWSEAFLLAQNTMFDAAILAWHYGVRPKALLDTLGMSRALFPHEKSHSLDAQTERAGIGAKGDEVVHAIGKRYIDFDADALARYGRYCCNDVDLTYKLFKRYTDMGFPTQELRLIDLTLRMFTEPLLRLDAGLLISHLHEVKDRKQTLLDRLRVKLEAPDDDSLRDRLMSNPQFAELLRECGVEPPIKISPTTGREAYAFAKSDEAFVALADHPDERVQALVAARLGVKTTLEETRTSRFIEMAGRGAFPVPLRYYGAHSGRWCLTGDHEVLTPGGWVRLDAWAGEPIRQWNAQTKEISWCPASDMSMNSFAVNELLVEFSGKYHRAMYTGEHRLPVRNRHTEDAVRDVAAGRMVELRKKELYVSGYAAPDMGQVDANTLRLIVAMHADGYNVQDAKHNMVRFRFSRQRKIERLSALLTSKGIPFTVHSYPSEPHVTVIAIKGRDAPGWLRPAKTLPMWFYLLGGDGARVVVEELQHWDGYAHTSEHFEWSGNDAEAAKVFATLAHLCGYRTITRLTRRNGSGWGDTWTVRFTRTTTITEKGENAKWVPFVGKVYCPTVTTGYFLCRRQDTIFITGNSGQDQVNLQNLPSRGADAGKLKKAILPPESHVVIDSDSSQIEARTLAWLAGQDDIVEAFRNKEDVYKLMASRVYGKPPEEISKTERFIGKVLVLSCGYGVGHKKLRAFLKSQAKVEVDEAEAQRLVDTYRQANYKIVELWKRADTALTYLHSGMTYRIDVHGLILVAPGKGITLPNKLHIQYPGLRQVFSDTGKSAWMYDSKGVPTYIYGNKTVENITQAVARCIIAEQMLRIARKYPVVLTVHDSVACVAPKAQAEEAQAYVEECMRWVPAWARGLPLDCELGVGDSYGAC